MTTNEMYSCLLAIHEQLYNERQSHAYGDILTAAEEIVWLLKYEMGVAREPCAAVPQGAFDF